MNTTLRIFYWLTVFALSLGSWYSTAAGAGLILGTNLNDGREIPAWALSLGIQCLIILSSLALKTALERVLRSKSRGAFLALGLASLIGVFGVFLSAMAAFFSYYQGLVDARLDTRIVQVFDYMEADYQSNREAYLKGMVDYYAFSAEEARRLFGVWDTERQLQRTTLSGYGADPGPRWRLAHDRAELYAGLLLTLTGDWPERRLKVGSRSIGLGQSSSVLSRVESAISAVPARIDFAAVCSDKTQPNELFDCGYRAYSKAIHEISRIFGSLPSPRTYSLPTQLAVFRHLEAGTRTTLVYDGKTIPGSLVPPQLRKAPSVPETAPVAAPRFAVFFRAVRSYYERIGNKVEDAQRLAEQDAEPMGDHTWVAAIRGLERLDPLALEALVPAFLVDLALLGAGLLMGLFSIFDDSEDPFERLKDATRVFEEFLAGRTVREDLYQAHPAGSGFDEATAATTDTFADVA